MTTEHERRGLEGIVRNSMEDDHAAFRLAAADWIRDHPAPQDDPLTARERLLGLAILAGLLVFWVSVAVILVVVL